MWGRIVLTDHAEHRCRTRGVDPARLIRDCRTLPPFHNSIEWHFPGRYTVVAARKGDDISVVTVYWPKFKRKRARV